MGLVYSERNGLFVAEQGADYASVLKALREHDPDLRLVPQLSDSGTVWQVYKYVGSDRDSVFVCGWWNDRREPLPLSHGVVDMVKKLDRNLRGHDEYVSADQANARELARAEADLDAKLETIAEENAKRSRRAPALPRSQSLMRARHRPGGRWSE